MDGRKRPGDEMFYDPNSGKFIKRTKYYEMNKQSVVESQVSFPWWFTKILYSTYHVN